VQHIYAIYNGMADHLKHYTPAYGLPFGCATSKGVGVRQSIQNWDVLGPLPWDEVQLTPIIMPLPYTGNHAKWDRGTL